MEGLNIEFNRECKVYFKSAWRAPMIGYFVSLSDSHSLSSKRMVRFINSGYFTGIHEIANSKIFLVDSFQTIKYIGGGSTGSMKGGQIGGGEQEASTDANT